MLQLSPAIFFMANNLLTPEEQYKFEIITKVISHEIKPGRAALMLDLSTRQIRRLRVAVLDGGSEAAIHGLRGKRGNHHIDKSIKEKTLKIVKEKYSDFKPTLASEVLADYDCIKVNPQTLRRWMTEYGLWKTRKQKKIEYRSWRPRKEYFGEMEQFDGSYHHWFENRCLDELGDPVEVCLLASIDDATGKITGAEFAKNEGITAVFNFWKGYVLNIGKPLNIYLDKFSTYKINHKAAVDNHEFMTQFQRAMLDVGINLISAHSPEAKGRIERLFLTLQDRLVKEMRLANISTPEEGNRFLKEVFLPKFNTRFTVAPAKEGDVHKKLSEIDKKNLNRIFSVQSRRRVNNDFTIQFKNHWYQLTELQLTTVRAGDRVIAEEWLDGTIHFSLKEKYLNYAILSEKPEKIKQPPLILTTHKLNWKPPLNHPWRKRFEKKS
jgi:hypothetical protein